LVWVDLHPAEMQNDNKTPAWHSSLHPTSRKAYRYSYWVVLYRFAFKMET